MKISFVRRGRTNEQLTENRFHFVDSFFDDWSSIKMGARQKSFNLARKSEVRFQTKCVQERVELIPLSFLYLYSSESIYLSICTNRIDEEIIGIPLSPDYLPWSISGQNKEYTARVEGDYGSNVDVSSLKSYLTFRLNADSFVDSLLLLLFLLFFIVQ